ncbi:hypothetical protein J7M02_02100, partial [Candidatus Aerophobetes bacterium]|nr:hypothetical protein [Candidatus Aerophobetes bacterium]
PYRLPQALAHRRLCLAEARQVLFLRRGKERFSLSSPQSLLIKASSRQVLEEAYKGSRHIKSVAEDSRRLTEVRSPRLRDGWGGVRK